MLMNIRRNHFSIKFIAIMIIKPCDKKLEGKKSKALYFKFRGSPHGRVLTTLKMNLRGVK